MQCIKSGFYKDIIGTEICGSIKNVIAIAAGMLEGMNMPESTQAMFITESLHDIKELIKALGGDGKTMIDFYHYVGITSLSKGKHAVNCFCFEHYDPNFNADISDSPSDESTDISDDSIGDESLSVDTSASADVSISTEQSVDVIAPAA